MWRVIINSFRDGSGICGKSSRNFKDFLNFYSKPSMASTPHFDSSERRSKSLICIQIVWPASFASSRCGLWSGQYGRYFHIMGSENEVRYVDCYEVNTFTAKGSHIYELRRRSASQSLYVLLVTAHPLPSYQPLIKNGHRIWNNGILTRLVERGLNDH
jgi:hypothetical protein